MGGVALIIPVINEAETIAAVVRDVPRSIVDVVIVVDGGSTDMTAARARQAGALVLVESQSGYGAACLAGIRAAPADCHIVAFIDGDGSDDPRDILGWSARFRHRLSRPDAASREAWGSTRSSPDIARALSFKRACDDKPAVRESASRPGRLASAFPGSSRMCARACRAARAHRAGWRAAGPCR